MKAIRAALALAGYFVLPAAAFLGWLFWMWAAIQLGSFAMFAFGLLGPLALPAAALGLWLFLFGVPGWLLALIGAHL